MKDIVIDTEVGEQQKAERRWMKIVINQTVTISFIEISVRS